MSSAASCQTNHGMTALSFFSATTSCTLLVTTVPLNIVVIAALLSNKELARKSLFFKIILNIAIADLLTGLLSDPTSISFHTKEGLGKAVYKSEAILLHCSLFLINGASILTMAMLCIDRTMALLNPFGYRHKSESCICIIVLVSTWFIAGLLIIPYFMMGYIKYLTIFSFVTITIAGVSLMFMLLYYKKNLKQMATPPTLNQAGEQRKQNRVSATERRVNQSFSLMLLVFLLTYLPACLMTLYMNLCMECDCVLIHVLRDLTYLSILSSAFFRPLNFVWRLSILRKACKGIIGVRDNSITPEF